MQNFVSHIQAQVKQHPGRTALVVPDYRSLSDWRPSERLTFGQLGNRVAGYAAQLDEAGIEAGNRVVVLLPLSADLYAVVLAVMARGATAVLMDPGFSRRRMIRCIKKVRPHAVVAPRSVLKYRFFLPFLRRIPLKMSVGYEGWGVKPLMPASVDAPSLEPVRPGDEQVALITFTSGTTGRPKGALRTHATLIHQHRALKESFPPREEEVALTCFPVVVLHDLCCGTTSVLPALSFDDIAGLNPEWILRQVKAESVTTLSGGPAFLQALTEYVGAQSMTLRQIRRLGTGGAPVDVALCEAVMQHLPEAEASIIYGSTEAEPVASMPMEEAVRLHASGQSHRLGYPAGHVHPATRTTIIRPHAGPVGGAGGPSLAHLEREAGDWGELLVSGEHVVTAYFEDPEADRANKVIDKQGRIWHRMGDIASQDPAGRIWLGGRLSQLIRREGRYIYPFIWEARLNRLPGVTRAALHEVDGRLLLWIEGDRLEEISDHIQSLFKEASISLDHIFSASSIPVDPRHHAKVDYAALEERARKRLRRVDEDNPLYQRISKFLRRFRT